MNRNKKCVTLNSKGFTIFELIVVISIIGVLAMVLYPKMQNRELAAKIQLAESDMLRVYEASETWKANRGQANFTNMNYAALGSDGLLDVNRKNPWGNAYSLSLASIKGTDDSVVVNSGTIGDANVRSQLQSRFRNKGYEAGIAGTAVTFRAPY